MNFAIVTITSDSSYSWLLRTSIWYSHCYTNFSIVDFTRMQNDFGSALIFGFIEVKVVFIEVVFSTVLSLIHLVSWGVATNNLHSFEVIAKSPTLPAMPATTRQS